MARKEKEARKLREEQERLEQGMKRMQEEETQRRLEAERAQEYEREKQIELSNAQTQAVGGETSATSDHPPLAPALPSRPPPLPARLRKQGSAIWEDEKPSMSSTLNL